MAINVGQRNVPDTPQTTQCYAVDSALDLTCHTLKLCKNHNIFTDEYVEIRNAIIELVTDLYSSAYSANRTRVKDNDDWERRSMYQEQAITLCNNLLGYINIAKRVYHLRRNKVEYWVNKAIATRNLLSKWHQADAKRYTGM